MSMSTPPPPQAMPTSLRLAAAPVCGVDGCELPALGYEQSWQMNGDGDWLPKQTALKCAAGHRRILELF